MSSVELSARAGPGEVSVCDDATSGQREFSRVYRAMYARVAALIFRRVGDRDVTMDVAAEVFARAWAGWGRFRRRETPVDLWLLRIATNEVNRWVQAERRRRKREEAGARRDQVMEQSRDDADEARRAMWHLALKHQEVLSLHYLQNLSVRETAEVLGVSEGTVKSRLARAREALARAIESRKARGMS